MPTAPLTRRVAALLFSLALSGAALASCATGPTQTARATSTPTATATVAPIRVTVTPTSAPSTPTGIPAGWTYYQDPSYHFALEVPASWSSGSSADDFYDQGTAPNGDDARLDVFVSSPVPTGTDERQFCSSPKTTTVGGFPAVLANGTPASGTGNIGPWLARLFVANGLFYRIQLSSPQSSLSQVQQRLGPLFAQILASFAPGPGQPGDLSCAS